MRFIPFVLKDIAKKWLYNLPANSISSWDDFVAGTWAGSYVGKWIENSVDSGGNWVDETEQGIGVEIVALVAL